LIVLLCYGNILTAARWGLQKTQQLAIMTIANL
jgi:hypothetical protein